MKKFKIWLFKSFFPVYVDILMKERISELEIENIKLRAYIQGVETAMKAQRKIQIKNEVVK